MKSVNRSKTLIEFLSNDTQEYIDEMTKANKTWIKGLKSKIFNSQILADIVLSEKEKKVRVLEKQLLGNETTTKKAQKKQEPVSVDQTTSNKSQFPKKFAHDANNFAKNIYETLSKNKKIYDQAFVLSTEIQNQFSNLSSKINKLSDLINLASQNYRDLEYQLHSLDHMKHFKQIDIEQRKTIGKEKDQSTVSLNYDLLKEKLYTWSESFHKTAGYLHYFMDPYFEKSLNRIEDSMKNFKVRNGLVDKKQQEEAKLRLDSVANIGIVNESFDYRRVIIEYFKLKNCF